MFQILVVYIKTIILLFNRENLVSGPARLLLHRSSCELTSEKLELAQERPWNIPQKALDHQIVKPT